MPTPQAIYTDSDNGATLDDLREAVTIFEDTERTARRVFGGHTQSPRTLSYRCEMRDATLRARETPSPPAPAPSPSPRSEMQPNAAVKIFTF